MSKYVTNFKFFLALTLLLFIVELLFHGFLSTAITLVLIFTLIDAFDGTFIARETVKHDDRRTNRMNSSMLFLIECIYTFLPTFALAISDTDVSVLGISAVSLLTFSLVLFIALKLFLFKSSKFSANTIKRVGILWKSTGIVVLIYISVNLIYESFQLAEMTGYYLGVATFVASSIIYLLLLFPTIKKAIN